MPVELDRPYELHPQVSLRPEPFGALAYHHGNRRLVFMKHPDMVAVVRGLDQHGDLAGALQAAGVERDRWPSFVAALSSLRMSEIVRERAG
jgi:putative mycofactocin binding protein MftB